MNRKFLLHMYFKWSSCELHMKFICNYVWNIEVAMIFICISFEIHMTHRPELSNEISYEWYEPSVVEYTLWGCSPDTRVVESGNLCKRGQPVYKHKTGRHILFINLHAHTISSYMLRVLVESDIYQADYDKTTGLSKSRVSLLFYNLWICMFFQWHPTVKSKKVMLTMW